MFQNLCNAIYGMVIADKTFFWGVKYGDELFLFNPPIVCITGKGTLFKAWTALYCSYPRHFYCTWYMAKCFCSNFRSRSCDCLNFSLHIVLIGQQLRSEMTCSHLDSLIYRWNNMRRDAICPQWGKLQICCAALCNRLQYIQYNAVTVLLKLFIWDILIGQIYLKCYRKWQNCKFLTNVERECFQWTVSLNFKYSEWYLMRYIVYKNAIKQTEPY